MTDDPSIYASFVLGTLTLYYVWFVVRIYRGLSRIGDRGSVRLEPVTVILAARNETSRIERCIESVLAQDYPENLLELIVVDDVSEDGTAELVRSRYGEDPRVRVLSLPPRDNLLTGRKPEAIAVGVSHARGTYVLTTDADCFHGTDWVRSMLSWFDERTALVAGPVTLEPASGLFPAVERLDFLGLIVSGAGLIGSGRPIVCNGANLAYRTSAYRAASDTVQLSSNDDGTLMSRIFERRIGGVRFALDPAAVVHTEGMRTLPRYFRQRMRWASVRGRFLDPTIYTELAALFVYFAALLGFSIASLLYPSLLIPVMCAWLVKLSVDALALFRGCRALNISVSIPMFFLAQLFHPIGIVGSTLLSLAFSFSWKGRRFRR